MLVWFFYGLSIFAPYYYWPSHLCLVPTVMAFGDRGFGRYLGHNYELLMVGLVPL